MRIVLTTVKEAKVVIDDKTVGQIDRGYLLLVGFTQGDNQETVTKMMDKVLSLRVFPDENGKTNLSLQDVGGKILSVSQFTSFCQSQFSAKHCQSPEEEQNSESAAKGRHRIDIESYFCNIVTCQHGENTTKKLESRCSGRMTYL